MYNLIILLLLVSVPLSAKSYLSEYRGNGLVIIFQGDIKEGDEDEVRSLQTQYLESLANPNRPNRPHNIEVSLNRYGVKITKMKDNPYIDSENAQPYFAPERGNQP
jgi:hypothetical protein